MPIIFFHLATFKDLEKLELAKGCEFLMCKKTLIWNQSLPHSQVMLHVSWCNEGAETALVGLKEMMEQITNRLEKITESQEERSSLELVKSLTLP